MSRIDEAKENDSLDGALLRGAEWVADRINELDFDDPESQRLGEDLTTVVSTIGAFLDAPPAVQGVISLIALSALVKLREG